MPALAGPRGWPVSADHCFQRILLDHAVGGRWYDHVAGRPAYAYIAVDALARAVAMAEAVVAGEADLQRLNRQSLRWRSGKTRAGEREPQRDAGAEQERGAIGAEIHHGE